VSDLAENLERIELLKARWDTALPLPQRLLESLREDWEVTQTYNSNAIEGNTLTLAETKVILLHGVTVGGKQIDEHLEAVNHRDAMRIMFVMSELKQPLEETQILELQRVVLSRIQDDDAGRYRSTRVRVTGSSRIFPNPVKVPDLMTELVARINAMIETAEHPVLIAAAAHFGLVHIHPFADGTGRTARLLMNLILLRHGYPPALLPVEKRLEYYQTLELANAGNTTPFDAFIAQITLESLETMLAVIA
jgi:Fic family protein